MSVRSGFKNKIYKVYISMNNYIKKSIYKVAIFVTIIFANLCGNVHAQKALAPESIRWNKGEVISYENNWIEIIVGDMPLVISVPHGGFMEPESIPDRDCKGVGNGRFVKGVDGNTIETARAIQAAFQEIYNKTPYIVISNIARTKVDQNRDMDLAACSNELANRAWFNFHNGIDTALAAAVHEFGQAVFIDLHGHGHKNQRLELGYALTSNDLMKTYNSKGSPESFSDRSSLQNLLKENSEADFKELLWGKNAFGTLMQNEGIPAVPAMQDIYPAEDEKFFSGGFTVRRYTGSDYPNVFGWQVECNRRGIRDTEENRKIFAESFSKAMQQFMKSNMNYKL